MSNETEKCAYCYKVRPSEEMESYRLTFRSRDGRGKAILAHRMGRYCKETGCAGKDQMAHEG